MHSFAETQLLCWSLNALVVYNLSHRSTVVCNLLEQNVSTYSNCIWHTVWYTFTRSLWLTFTYKRIETKWSSSTDQKRSVQQPTNGNMLSFHKVLQCVMSNSSAFIKHFTLFRISRHTFPTAKATSKISKWHDYINILFIHMAKCWLEKRKISINSKMTKHIFHIAFDNFYASQNKKFP